MERATIHDYARMCRTYSNNCAQCPMVNAKCNIAALDNIEIDKANEIILKWCKEHPVETRQDRFLKMFPNAKIDNCGMLILCPRWIDKDFKCNRQRLCCTECEKEYWLAEVEI